MGNERENSNRDEDILPGERTFDVPGLKTHEQFLEQLKEGKVSDAVSALQEDDKHIVANWRPGKITLLIAGSVGLLGVAVASGVLLRKKNKGSSNSQDTL